MQGLLLVWRGCLFAGCTGWMCTADEATSFPRSRDRSTTEQAGFYQSINVCHGGYSSLFIVMSPNLGNALLIQQPRFWPFFLPSPPPPPPLLFSLLSFPSYTFISSFSLSLSLSSIYTLSLFFSQLAIPNLSI